MSYVSEHLGADEKIVHESKIHWIGYVPPAILFVLALMFSRGDGTQFAGILMLLAVLMLVRSVIIQKTTELAVTNKRIIAKAGFIQRYTVEVQHRQVESIQVSQTALGRMLDYGNVHIHGTGGGRTPIGFIAKPLEFRRQAMEHIDRLQGGAGPAVVLQNAGGGIPSLQDLIAMKEKGHITDEEFAQFKKKILAQ